MTIFSAPPFIFQNGQTADASQVDAVIAQIIANGNANAAPLSGSIAQIVTSLFGAVANGTQSIPYDDTVPQQTEGDQYMALTITPKSASSTLIITTVANLSCLVPDNIQVALFRDAIANALAATTVRIETGVTEPSPAVMVYTLFAGSTNATTFKVRAGANGATTTTFNGSFGQRKFGGVMASSMMIWEILP